MVLYAGSRCHDAWIFITFAVLSLVSMQCSADISVFTIQYNQLIDGGYTAMASKFGPSIPIDGFTGLVVYADPPDGCDNTTVKVPPSYFNYTGRWIILMKRGNCDFVDKVRNAQNANYDMAIVHNNSTEVSPMHATNADDVHIPSVFVNLHTGLKIQKDYQYYNAVYLLVEDDSNFPFDLNADLLIPFIVVVAVCFITMISFMICKCVRDRRRARRHRLPASSLRKLQVVKFTKGSPYETCAICLDDYIEGEKLRVLPCAHGYHTKCIDPWLTRNRRVCPICKRKVFAADEIPGEGSDSDSDTDNDERTPLVRPEPSLQPHISRTYMLYRERILANLASLAREEGTSRSSNEAPVHRPLMANRVRSLNSADGDSVLDMSPASSLYSYDGAGCSTGFCPNGSSSSNGDCSDTSSDVHSCNA